MNNRIFIFFTDQKGASAVEYGVLIAFIVLIMLTGLSSIGTNIANIFNTLKNNL